MQRAGDDTAGDAASLVGSPRFSHIRFPDIIVDRAGEAPKDLTGTAPVLIAEVLSPSSEQVDLGDKSTEYLQLPSLAIYLVFAQDTRTCVLEGEDAVVRSNR